MKWLHFKVGGELTDDKLLFAVSEKLVSVVEVVGKMAASRSLALLFSVSIFGVVIEASGGFRVPPLFAFACSASCMVNCL